MNLRMLISCSYICTPDKDTKFLRYHGESVYVGFFFLCFRYAALTPCCGVSFFSDSMLINYTATSLII